MQPENYADMDAGRPFRADVGMLNEEQLRQHADQSCKRCNSTGREGFIEGVAIVCRCVKKRIIAKGGEGT